MITALPATLADVRDGVRVLAAFVVLLAVGCVLDSHGLTRRVDDLERQLQAERDARRRGR